MGGGEIRKKGHIHIYKYIYAEPEPFL